MTGAFIQGILDTYPNPTPDDINYLTAVAGMFEQVYSIVADSGYVGSTSFVPGWSGLLDPVNCPTEFLPFLAQFAGCTIPVGTPDQQARQIIQLEAGQNRGTLAAIQSAALRYLVGTSTNIGSLQYLGETDIPIPVGESISALNVMPLTGTLAPQTITITDPTDTYTQQFLVLSPVYPNSRIIPIYPAVPNYAYPAGSIIQGPLLLIRERYNGIIGYRPDPYHLTLACMVSEVTNQTALINSVNAVKPCWHHHRLRVLRWISVGYGSPYLGSGHVLVECGVQDEPAVGLKYDGK